MGAHSYRAETLVIKAVSGAGIDNATGDHRAAVLAREAGLKSVIESSQTGQLSHHPCPVRHAVMAWLPEDMCPALPCIGFLRAITHIFQSRSIAGQG